MYFVLVLGIICGIFHGFNKMSVSQKKNIPHRNPENIIDFLLNG